MLHPKFFSEVVKKIRRDRGLTQEQLGEMLGIGRNSVWQYEQGRNFPDDDLLPKISGLTSYTVDELKYMKTAIGLERDGIDLEEFVLFLANLQAA